MDYLNKKMSFGALFWRRLIVAPLCFVRLANRQKTKQKKDFLLPTQSAKRHQKQNI